MPTTLPRTSVTHTPPVQRMLTVAESRWPGAESRELILRLMEEGERMIRDNQAHWNRSVEVAASTLTALVGDEIPDTWKQERDAEWPA